MRDTHLPDIISGNVRGTLYDEIEQVMVELDKVCPGVSSKTD